MKRLGLATSGVPYDVRTLVDLAQKAEKASFESMWVAEDYYAREAVTTLACYAYNTRKIKLGTSILNPYTRHSAILALTFATLDELSGGRMILGIGAGFPPMMKQLTSYFSPLTMIRESTQVIRDLYSKETVNFEGKGVKAQNVSLGVCSYLAPVGTFKLVRRNIPIYVGSMGPKMLDLAGEVGDGLLISVGYSIPHTKDSIARAKAGAVKAGRKPEDLDIACLIAGSASKDGSVDEGTKGMVASMLAYFFNEEQLQMSGFTMKDADPLKQAFEKGGWREAAKLVTPKMLETYAAAGKPDQIVDRLLEYEKAGVKIPVLFVMGGDLDRIIEAGKTYIHST